MNLEQAIKKILDGENKKTKTFFLCEMLQDMNWHEECKMLYKKYEKENKYKNEKENDKVINMHIAIIRMFGCGLANNDFDGNIKGEKLVEYLFEHLINS